MQKVSNVCAKETKKNVEKFTEKMPIVQIPGSWHWFGRYCGLSARNHCIMSLLLVMMESKTLLEQVFGNQNGQNEKSSFCPFFLLLKVRK